MSEQSLGNLLGAVLAGAPDSLLAQLPPELRPDSVSFYYDHYTESQQLQQAALAQTGQQSFINGLAWDSQNNLSVNDQQKLALYNNAADYAKANHIALGQALTDDQVKALDAPMLWYVEQAVPDPRCTAASSVCPSVNALVPQVYLPEGYAQALSLPTGGTISGDNIKIAVDGQLRNTGQVVANDTLTVKAGSIDLSPNVVSIGTNAYKAQGGWNVVTGTVVQPGGFLSAMHMDIEAESIRAINDAFRITRADGSVDADASAALVAQLKESLGLNYVEGTVADDIHTQFIKEKKGLGVIGQIVAMVAAVAASIVTAGAAAAAMGVALSSMTLGQAMMVAALSSMAGSMASQIVSGQGLNFGKIAQAGLIGAVTAGLTNGITFDGSSFGVSEWGQSLKNTNTLANLAGSNSAGGVLQAAKDGATGTIYQQAVGMIGTGLINAGVSTAFNGGSFGQALLNNLVAQAAALGAKGIGGATDALTLENVASHAALGCAAQSAMGGDCASGAIGGATSAIVAPVVRDGLYGGGESVTTTFNADGTITTTTSYNNPAYNAMTAAIAMLAGGGLAGIIGRDGVGAAGAAQNEALNNATSTKSVTQTLGDWLKTTYGDVPGDIDRWRREFLGMLPVQTPPTEANPLVDSTNQGNPPATGGAVVTPPVMACSPNGQCVLTPPVASAGAPGNAILSSGDGASDPKSPDAASDSGVPGRAQSRINVTNEGIDHIVDRHLDPSVNASQFKISESDLRDLLARPNTVSAPITRTISSGAEVSYVREVDAGRVIGTDKFNNYQPTSTMTVITDKYGNLLTAFPGKLK